MSGAILVDGLRVSLKIPPAHRTVHSCHRTPAVTQYQGKLLSLIMHKQPAP